MYIKRIKKKGERDICDEKKRNLYTYNKKKNGTANKKKGCTTSKTESSVVVDSSPSQNQMSFRNFQEQCFRHRFDRRHQRNTFQ